MFLDNPIWASLTTLHRQLARTGQAAARYPADVAPFLAVREGGASAAGLADRGETLFAVGPCPAGPSEELGVILQMVCAERLPEVPGPPIAPLTEAHRPAVLELTALVYPHYFRPRTMDLGRYFGVLENGRLAAMIGERMGMPGFREISAVCTHPDFLGRGLARRLLAFLTNDIASHGDTPFLHVSPNNERAVRLYEQNGYRTRSELPFAAIKG